MLQVVYTADGHGKYVVPFVDTTRDTFVNLLKGLPEGTTLVLTEWEIKLVKDALASAALERAKESERAEAPLTFATKTDAIDWATMSESPGLYITTYDSSVPEAAIDGALVLELGDEEELSGGDAPLFDLYSYAYDVMDCHDVRVVVWRRFNFEVDFDVEV